MMKLIGSLAALSLFAAPAFAEGSGSAAEAKAPKAKKVMTKGGHASKAHVCKDASGNELKTTEKTKSAKAGSTIRREKTCTAEGGTWTPVNAAEKGSGSAAKTAKAHKGGKKGHKAAKGSAGSGSM